MSRPVLKKREIEEAAMKLFSSKGIPSTTIRDIATEASVAEGTLYRYYKSKKQMAIELFCEELTKFSYGLKKILLQEKDINKRIEDGIKYIYDFYNTNIISFTFILLSQHGFPEEIIPDEINPYTILEMFILNGIKMDEIKKVNPYVYTGIVFGIVIRPLIMHRYKKIDNKEATDFVEEIIISVKKVLLNQF